MTTEVYDLRVYYRGFQNVQLEERLDALMEEFGLFRWASGYNYEDSERDIAYDNRDVVRIREMTTDNARCCVRGCPREATIWCGTWPFCTECAISQAGVTMDEKGRGEGAFGSAFSDDPQVIDQIRSAQRERVQVIRTPYQPEYEANAARWIDGEHSGSEG
jgi:hypothetical protein